MTKRRTARISLPEELFLKYKVFCSMNDMNMTQQTEHIIREFIKEQSEIVKIIKVNKT